jgi:RHS repeat-associated protein
MSKHQYNQLEAYYTEEGRINLQTGYNNRHEYNITDHLGNTRVCFTPPTDNTTTPWIIQQTNYYAYGLPIKNLTTTYNTPLVGGTPSLVNRYQYNGKEFETDLGLMWNDYGARWYDPQRSVWGQIDPLAEKYAAWSGYNYVGSNPIKRIDLNGMDWYSDQDGNKEWIDSKADTYIKSDNSSWMRFEHPNYLDAVEITPKKEAPPKVLDIADSANTSAGLGVDVLGTTIDALKIIEPTLDAASVVVSDIADKLGILGLAIDAAKLLNDPSLGRATMLGIDVAVFRAGGPATLGIVDGVLDLTGKKDEFINYIDDTQFGQDMNKAGSGIRQTYKESRDGLYEMIMGEDDEK